MTESLSDLMAAVWKAWGAQPSQSQMARAFAAIRALRDEHGGAVCTALRQLAELPKRRPPEELADHVEALIAQNAARHAKSEAQRREREREEAENARRNAEIDADLRLLPKARDLIRAYKLTGSTRHGSPQEYAASIAKRYGHPLAALLEVANAKAEPNKPEREEPPPSIDAPPDKLAEVEQELEAFTPTKPTPVFDKVVAKAQRNVSAASGTLFDEGHQDPESA